MENLDSSEQIREVFARFGLAAYQAQCVERTIAIALASVFGPATQTRDQYSDLLERNFKRTLGSLIGRLRESVSFDANDEEGVTSALEKRNWLVHNYFWDRAVEFQSFQGREAMIHELQETAGFLASVDERFAAIVREWRLKRGVTDDMVQAEMDKLLLNETRLDNE